MDQGWSDELGGCYNSMGDSLSSCCTPPENLQFVREIITQEGSDGFDSFLKDFLARFPRMRDLYSKKWSYCPNIDRTKITIRPEGTFVGELHPSNSHEAIVFYNEGFLYEGELLGGRREGLGRLVSADGECYEGKWHNDEPHGEGIFQGATPKRKYTGVWQAGLLEGHGRAAYEDGSHYQGQFHANSRHGRGSIKYADGSHYDGDFRNDQIEGFGTMIGINHKYEGSWRGGKMDGAGKSSWFNEHDELLETYEGQYENGLKQGKGEYRWSNGRVFKGEWANGEIVKPKEKK